MMVPQQRPDLKIQLHGGNTEPDEPCKKTLVHATVLLKRHVLNNRGQLIVVADENRALQTAGTAALALQKQWNKRLDFQNLGSFLHDK